MDLTKSGLDSCSFNTSSAKHKYMVLLTISPVFKSKSLFTVLILLIPNFSACVTLNGFTIYKFVLS